jgi:hypothetical protein
MQVKTTVGKKDGRNCPSCTESTLNRVRVTVTSPMEVYRQSVRLGDKPLETHDRRFCFNWTLAVIVLTWHPLWREDGSDIYNCCWHSPAQSFSGLSPAGLIITFYSLMFETPPTCRASPRIYIPQEQGGPVTPPGTGFPFRRLLRLAGLPWDYSNPPPHGVTLNRYLNEC